MGEWEEVTLEECADLIRETVSPSDAENMLYIGLEHIGENTLSLLKHGQASDVTSTKSRFKKGDTLFGKLRPYFRKVIEAPFNGICSTDIWVIRAKEGIDQRFLHYCVASPQFIEHSVSGSEGTRMPRAKWDYSARHGILLPPLPEQRAIAHVLGTLDDKIDLNRRMNETLEEMARAIFRDWFVDFGPTRAKMEGRPPYLAPELWELFPDTLDDAGKPAGWEVSLLGDQIEILDSKRIPLSSREREQRQGPYPYHGAAGVIDYVEDYLFEGVHILLGEDGSVTKPDGKPFTQYVWGQFWANNHAHVLRGKGISNEMLLCFLQQTDITPYVTGTVQPKLNQKNLKAIPFPASGSDVAVAFEKVVGPLFEQFRLHSNESLTLSEARDLLLPKLISGEIRLAEAGEVIS